MEAPTYPPAATFEQPIAVPYELSVETASLEDLMSAPAAWAVVLKHAPVFRALVNAPQVKPNLGNFTVDGFIVFGLVSPALVAAINTDLQQLPRNQWPAP